MKIEYCDINSITPYHKNPRKNKAAIQTVKESLREFGFKQPLVVDKDRVVIVGHTRLSAARELGFTTVPVLVAEDLNEAQCRAYRIMDNRSNENAEWDWNLLVEEFELLQDYDLTKTGFSEKEIEDLLADAAGESIYTKKVDTPLYTPKGEKPQLNSLINEQRYEELKKNIESSDIDVAEKEFLLKAAARHREFDYENIAEYYCHADAKVQKLMEDSALVIIDFNRAIELGYVRLNDALRNNYIEEYGDDAQ